MHVAWMALSSVVVCGCAQADAAAPSSSDSGTDTRPADSGAPLDSARDLGVDDVHPDGIFPTEDTDGVDSTDDGTTPIDTSPVDTTPLDTTPPDTTPPTCATPSGTTATASGAYASAPTDAIDGDPSTYWNAGDFAGWIDLKFPHAVYFDRIRIAATALPACSEPYTFTGYLAGAPTVLASVAIDVPGSPSWVPSVTVPPGSWDELRIDVGTSASWIAIGEIVVYDSAGGCALP